MKYLVLSLSILAACSGSAVENPCLCQRSERVSEHEWRPTDSAPGGPGLWVEVARETRPTGRYWTDRELCSALDIWSWGEEERRLYFEGEEGECLPY